MPDLHLLPYPRRLKLHQAVMELPNRGLIVLHSSTGKEDIFTAQCLRDALPATVKGNFRITPLSDRRVQSKAGPPVVFTLRRNKSIKEPEGYRLKITADGVLLEGGTSAGLFYAAMTLIQLLRHCRKTLPTLTIEDHPDFPRRGVYLDVSRGKVPKLKTLLQLVDDLALLKINEFQLYIENVYAFKNHPDMYSDTDPLTAEELRKIDAACRERFIDFVPSLTSLGHFDKILSRPAYRMLAEAEPAELKKQGIETWSDEPWSLNVTDPRAQKLLKEMYEDFLPNFTSKLFNCCCDESWDLGKGKSKPAADKIGVGQLYVDWVNYCAMLAARQGKRIQMWGDIILRHPELIEKLPKDAILLEWGYEADHKFEEHCKVFAASGREFYVAPGTSTWLSFAGRTNNAFGNMRSAAVSGKKHGAKGFLITDWGDHGHQQLLAVSFLPYAFGAAVSWNERDNSDEHVIRAANAVIFRDPKSQLAGLAADLGQTYERIGFKRFNGSTDFFLFREPWDTFNYVTRMTVKDLEKTIEHTQKILEHLKPLKSLRRDGLITLNELMLTAETIIYTCRRSILRKQWQAAGERIDAVECKVLSKKAGRLAEQLHRLWLQRNKPSRLLDVLYHFTRHQREYYSLASGPKPR